MMIIRVTNCMKSEWIHPKLSVSPWMTSHTLQLAVHQAKMRRVKTGSAGKVRGTAPLTCPCLQAHHHHRRHQISHQLAHCPHRQHFRFLCLQHLSRISLSHHFQDLFQRALLCHCLISRRFPFLHQEYPFHQLSHLYLRQEQSQVHSRQAMCQLVLH